MLELKNDIYSILKKINFSQIKSDEKKGELNKKHVFKWSQSWGHNTLMKSKI